MTDPKDEQIERLKEEHALQLAAKPTWDDVNKEIARTYHFIQERDTLRAEVARLTKERDSSYKMTDTWHTRFNVQIEKVQHLEQDVARLTAENKELDRQVTLNRENWRMDSEDKDKAIYKLTAERDEANKAIEALEENIAQKEAIFLRIGHLCGVRPNEFIEESVVRVATQLAELRKDGERLRNSLVAIKEHWNGHDGSAVRACEWIADEAASALDAALKLPPPLP